MATALLADLFTRENAGVFRKDDHANGADYGAKNFRRGPILAPADLHRSAAICHAEGRKSGYHDKKRIATRL